MTRQRSGPFLLNAANRQVLSGQSHLPAPPAGWAVHALLMLFILPFLIGGQSLASQLPETWSTWSRLNSQGVEAQATVVSLNKGRGRGRYYLTYAFQAADGRPFTHESRVNGALYEHLLPGSPLTIRYVPAEPVLSSPSPRETLPTGPLLATLFAVCLGGGILYLLVVAMRPIGFAWQYAQRGRLLTGEVVASRIRVVKGRRILVVTYRFWSPTARHVEGRAERGQGAQAIPEAGTELAIAYVDDRHHRAL